MCEGGSSSPDGGLVRSASYDRPRTTSLHNINLEVDLDLWHGISFWLHAIDTTHSHEIGYAFQETRLLQLLQMTFISEAGVITRGYTVRSARSGEFV